MSQPTFNLWHEPWIGLLDSSGDIEGASLQTTLTQAHNARGIYELSPLCAVGIHRLLVAILQDALQVRGTRDLVSLWNATRFDAEPVTRFGELFANRFDLFSPEAPFMQSGALALQPQKGDRVKTARYLYPDWPATGEITHFWHGQDSDAAFCPACAAAGLLLQPAFASSGGSGIRPSINGVPPIYVLPQGETLFHSLVASLTTPGYQPAVADSQHEGVWWRRREPVIEESLQVTSVSYLDSLLFPARQVRLHPEPAAGARCSRCGQECDWLVRTMVYQMGEYRSKEAALWQDPFVSYKMREKGDPFPLRPQEGKALWRDYGALLLAQKGTSGSIRPSVIDQIKAMAEEQWLRSDALLHFRCVGARTDGRAKVFEYVDHGLDMPFRLLFSDQAADDIERYLAFAEDVARELRRIWRLHFDPKRGGKNEGLQRRMEDRYWQELAAHFSRYALACAYADDEDALTARALGWLRCVTDVGERVFCATCAQIGDDAASLRERVNGEAHCHAQLMKMRKEQEGKL